MSNFIIQKTTTGNFYHIYNNARTKVNVSDFDVVLDDVALTFIIQCKNGSNIPSQAVSINLIQVIDLSVGTSPIPFSGIDELILLLKSISYTPYLQSLIITEPIRIYEVGQVGVFTMTPTQFTDNFDSTGLGRNTMLGWALRNGNNGTKNQQDKFSLNKGTSPYDVIGAIGGEAKHTLISSELPQLVATVATTGGGTGGSDDQPARGTGGESIVNYPITFNQPEFGLGHNNMPPYLIDVWVERVTALIFSGATGGGEGGSQTWSQTLDNGRNTGGFNPLINDDDAIDFENGSYIAKGTDEGTGGNGGIEQTCSIGYKWKWEAGEIYIRNQSGQITRKENARFAPTVNDDDTKDFIVNAYWEMYDGTLYTCTDNTTGAAAWEIYATNVPTFQQVTDEGNTTTNDIIVSKATGSSVIQVVNGDDALTFQVDSFGSLIELNDVTDAEYGSIRLGEIVMQAVDASIQLTYNYFGLSNNNAKPYIELSGSDGILTGSVSIKTDLVNGTYEQQLPSKSGTFAMLDDAVPYTGATADVNLGEFGLIIGNIEFDNTPTNIPTNAGAMVWNDTDGTLDLKLKGGNVTLQIGQEQVLRVVNKTATNINLLEANYQAVRVTGAQGQRLKVDLAQATSDNLSAETIGLVTETINNNQEGFITTSGLIRNINTTGSLQSETWADGDILYLSPTVAGRVTKTKPSAPNHLVIIGYVVSAHATQGSIFVKVDNGYELDELHNVKITTATNNQALTYTSATDIWENKTIIENAIVDSVTDKAPSQNAVFDALALKQNSSTLIFDSLQKAIMRDNYFWFVPAAITLGAGGYNFGTSERISGSTFTYLNNGTIVRGMLSFNTTATAGILAFSRRNDALILTSLEVVFTRKIQFNSNVSGQRFFSGISKGNQFAAPTNVEPSTLTDIVGVCQLSTSTNMHVVHNDASGTATTIDLGSSYPCNDSQYNYYITIEQTTTSYIVSVERVTIATGVSISTTNTLATNIPNYATGVIQLLTWISNNATAAIASYLDGGVIGNVKNQ